MMMEIESPGEMYPKVNQAIQKLSQVCKDAEGSWLLGGSCALWLQGVPLSAAPRDIDIYADTQHAGTLHSLLEAFALDEPELDESGLYKSRLSHYKLGNLTLELVGGFQVKTEGALYRTEVTDILAPAAGTVSLESEVVMLMPLAHEFIFNVLRARPDRYLPIAGEIRKNPKQHLPLLFLLLERNYWTFETIARMAELLDQPLLSSRWGELGSHEA
ncbi:hypothetical protein [Paenibacillus vini]|uniref:Nucleotidyl transferase AbiEii/AbiGii toxin family protein n=1 Tax=Paenibacillus vini TaxID=1476024 RepID=A0ABQ4M7X8_9BACL|nr:hypothetical protein [Paenibacillus vini]GIP52094.1 hypothetical protein J42TS3_11290 [Paenibacillus vini]